MKAKEIIENGLFNQAANLMDSEIREELHLSGQYETDYDFLVAYMEEHKKKYNEDFTI